MLPSYALRFEHPGGALRLLYDNPNATSPQYDLALLTPRILTERAKELAVAPAARDNDAAAASNERKYFWIAIATAAIVLLALLARLLAPAIREEAGSLGETPGGGDPSR